MIAEKKWYAVYTRPRWEKKVAGLLLSKHIDAYCPVNTVLKQWSDRKKMVEEPLFRSYVFVQVSSQEMLAVLQTDGVLKFVHWLNKPAVIRNEEIEIIRKYLREYSGIQVEPINMSVDDTVRIIRGPLTEQEGNILAVGRNKVRIYLQSLGYVMVVEVEKSSVQLVRRHELTPRTPLKSSALLQ